MRPKGIGKTLAILVVFVMIGSCGMMPSAGDVSESDGNSSSAALYVLEDAGYNTTIRAGNISNGEIYQVLFDPFSPSFTPFPTPHTPGVATIIDHTLCKDISKDLYPIDQTTRFYPDDKAAFCWFEAKGSQLHLFTMEWYDPYDRLYAINIGVPTYMSREPETLKGAGSINISGYPAANMPGKWYVKLYHEEFAGWKEPSLLLTEHFTIFPRLPDLVITDIWWSGSTIYYKIKNQGPENAGASYTSLSVDEVFKSSDYVAPLEPRAQRTENFSYNWAFTPPEDKIVVCADYLNNVTEIDETNNCGSTIYTDIQSKIDAANPGDTIIIKDGIYNANIKVNKRLTIRSENGSANCIVQALNPKAPIFEVSADYVNISGFTVKEADSGFQCNGIYLNNADYCNISNNNCYNSAGIFLRSSRENIITGNNVHNNNWHGIGLSSSSNNSITGNNVSNNNGDGIDLSSSSNNSITGNNVINNDKGIGLSSSSNNNTITGNNVSNNNGDGISLHSSSNNTITGNNVSNNNWGGIRINFSSSNTISGNNACNNSNDGISLWHSNNNKIYLNNFINNSDNVDSYKSTNIWNSPLEITYTYDGTTYKSYLGNYWDDYTGEDANKDGIGDTAYSIDGNNDNYPLMEARELYCLSLFTITR